LDKFNALFHRELPLLQADAQIGSENVCGAATETVIDCASGNALNNTAVSAVSGRLGLGMHAEGNEVSRDLYCTGARGTVGETRDTSEQERGNLLSYALLHTRAKPRCDRQTVQ
jgi:hypothetical protein